MFSNIHTRLATIALALCFQCFGQAPALFYSDLEGGPASGGANNKGVFVTLYGNRFGNTQGNSYVSIGSTPVASYTSWSDSKIVFQPGSAVSSGAIVVNTAYGRSSALSFTVRPGSIYFVDPGGDDTASGSFTSPWQTLLHARNTILPGDVVYARDGVSQTADDGEGWDASFTLRAQWCGGAYPRSLIAYPGATVTIGSDATGSPTSGLRVTDFSADIGSCTGGWVFAGITFRGIAPVNVNGPSSNWRFVGNDISCPATTGADGGGACFETSLASSVRFYGNNVHDAGAVNASALFQGVYFSTDSNDLDIGWNTIARVQGCRGLQIHSSPLGSGYPDSGYAQYDISIHDNVIHDTQCDGIIVDTIDPSKGPITVFNNLVYNAGLGPNNPEQSGAWSCLNFPGTVENGTTGPGVIEIYNNTFYNCGAFTSPIYGSANAGIIAGGGNAGQVLRLRDNIFYQMTSSLWPQGVPYAVEWDPLTREPCRPTDSCQWIVGSNNLFIGSGNTVAATALTASLFQDPQFVSRGSDFHISAASPANGTGTATPQRADLDGSPVTSTYSIGAYAGPVVLPPMIAVSVLQHVETSPGHQAVDLQFTNTGSGAAATLRMTALQVTRLAGTGLPAVDASSPTLPIQLPALGPGSSEVQRVVLDVPDTITRFRLVESVTATDAAGVSYSFAAAQAVIR
ncbi:MAG: IPT/TIG domain-containing protein [Acidobacteriota bacterium]|nr:IPT/TIG domain-containing protein [Acidobacteriota bacterium]